MTTQFAKRGTVYIPVDERNMNLENRLPPNNFRIAATPMGFQFELMDGFELPPKLYGETNAHAARILQTFQSREGTTGVLLSGEKGSGKSLLAKKISLEAAALGMPTLVISTPFAGEEFNALIQSVSQPAVVLLDEFEKVYDQKKQQEMLTLLDGTMTSKKLFILTCNDQYRIDSFMRNRPGRIFYSLDYAGLDQEFITEYCDDQGLTGEQKSGVITVASMFSAFNFDMLKALIEEMKRYNESALQAVRMMNMKPSYDEGGEYTVEVSFGGIPMVALFNCGVFRGSPASLKREQEMYVKFGENLPDNYKEVFAKIATASTEEDEDESEGEKRHAAENRRFDFTFGPNDLKGVNRATGLWYFQKDGFLIALKKKVVSTPSLASLAF